MQPILAGELEKPSASPEYRMSIIAEQNLDGPLTADRVEQVVSEGADRLAPEGKRVLAIIPDHTRTCPLPQIVRLLRKHIAGRAKQLDFLIALGTHPQLSEARIDDLLGIEHGRRADVLGDSKVFNHRWDAPDELTTIGTLTAGRIVEIAGEELAGFAHDVDVTINRRVLDYDVLLICGPVFPHEVVGFSGGSKYFFPGICGPELLNFFHWLGALITNPRIIGHKDTRVRRTLEAAADMVDRENYALSMVVSGEDLSGLFFGPVRDSWSAAADLSDKLHIVYKDHPYHSVLSCAPKMYDELWVAGKCMYKLEPVVADGGELIIYAPHLNEISETHGRIIEQIGYHTRDYFLAQWDKFKDYPWGVLAHSTHVRGIGSYENGVEKPRVTVTLASALPEETCRKVNLGYRDPASIDPTEWQDREDEGLLYVPKAGEMLYRLKNPPAWQQP
ncbi:MAG: lactate racemase domain-containing protein [Phycisphaerae bacterium]